MKKLIMQVYYEGHSKPIFDGGYIPDYELSIESEKRMKIYADSIGADYKMLREPFFKTIKNPGWNRFAMCWEDDYDEVCYVDADILVSQKALGHDIFAWPGVGKKVEQEDYPDGSSPWHVNAATLKLDRKDRHALKYEINKKPYLRMLDRWGKNQQAFNKAYYKATRRRPTFLDPRWNATRKHHDPRWFAHYIGQQKLPHGNRFGCMTDCPVYKEEW